MREPGRRLAQMVNGVLETGARGFDDAVIPEAVVKIGLLEGLCLPR